MTRYPVAGMVWLTIQYLLGFARLGYECYYVESSRRTPRMFMGDEDDGSVSAPPRFIDAA